MNQYNNSNLIITPINKNLKSKSYIDFCEQMSRINKRQQHMWDDSKDNMASRNDLFGYVQNCYKIDDTTKTDGNIIIFEITNVLKPIHRLDSWSDNVGHCNRNVIELSSNVIYSGTMKEFKQFMGYNDKYNLQGTRYIPNSKIYNYLQFIFKK